MPCKIILFFSFLPCCFLWLDWMLIFSSSTVRGILSLKWDKKKNELLLMKVWIIKKKFAGSPKDSSAGKNFSLSEFSLIGQRASHLLKNMHAQTYTHTQTHTHTHTHTHTQTHTHTHTHTSFFIFTHSLWVSYHAPQFYSSPCLLISNLHLCNPHK
jgi:hypothetical protein